MHKRILSVLLSICMLVCLGPIVQVTAETCVLDKSCWQEHWKELQCRVVAVKTSHSVPEGARSFNLNESGTVVGCVREEERDGKACEVCYIAPARRGDSVELPEDSSYLFSCNDTFDSTTVEEIDLSWVYTNNVSDMIFMFNDCRKLKSLDVTRFDTRNVTDMFAMFQHCSELTRLDLSHFDTRNVTCMTGMFYDCGLLESLDVSHFDTSKVTSMWDMFHCCMCLKSLDLSRFDTRNVTNMTGMFYDCINLTSLDLSHFDTHKVTDMEEMFDGCKSLWSSNIRILDNEVMEKIEKYLPKTF